MKKLLPLVILDLIFLLILFNPGDKAFGQLNGWSDLENVSFIYSNSTPPKLASDTTGVVHLMWAADSTFDDRLIVYYTRLVDGNWSFPVDVLSAQELDDAAVLALDIDRRGVIHVLYVTEGYDLFYSSSRSESATSAQGWSKPVKLADNASWSWYGGDLLVDSRDRIHILFSEQGSPELFHLYSDDFGGSWRDNGKIGGVLDSSPADSATSIMLTEDGAGRLHAAWTIRLFPEGWPGTRAFYTRSLDGGASWEPNILVDDYHNKDYLENRGPFFLSVGIRGRDEIHLVWAGAPNGNRWHQWSTDGGESWSNPEMFLDIFGTTGFEPMVEDSAGNLHLFTTYDEGIGNKNRPRQFIWSGNTFVETDHLPGGSISSCENPQVEITAGNRIHVVCHEEAENQLSDIFYSMKELQIQAIEPTPFDRLLEKPLSDMVADEEPLSDLVGDERKKDTTSVEVSSTNSTFSKEQPSDNWGSFALVLPTITVILVIGLLIWVKSRKS